MMMMDKAAVQARADALREIEAAMLARRGHPLGAPVAMPRDRAQLPPKGPARRHDRVRRVRLACPPLRGLASRRDADRRDASLRRLWHRHQPCRSPSQRYHRSAAAGLDRQRSRIRTGGGQPRADPKLFRDPSPDRQRRPRVLPRSLAGTGRLVLRPPQHHDRRRPGSGEVLVFEEASGTLLGRLSPVATSADFPAERQVVVARQPFLATSFGPALPGGRPELLRRLEAVMDL